MNTLSVIPTSRTTSLDELWAIWNCPICNDLSDHLVFDLRQPSPDDWKTIGGKILFQELYQLTQKGFCINASSALEQDVRNHIEQGDFLYLIKTCGSIIAYAVFDNLKMNDTNILYLSGIMISPDHQGQGLGGRLIKLALAKFQAKYLVARTQNPVMYESVRRCCGHVFPNESGNPPQDIVEVGQFIATEKLNMKNYNQISMLAKGTYGSSLYGVKPISIHHEMDHWFKTQINLDHGDAMIVVARNF